MKNTILILMILAAFNSFGIVKKESQKSLEYELDYKLSDDPNDQRRLASDPEDEVEPDEFQDDKKQDRDIANDVDHSISDTIQFWKY